MGYFEPITNCSFFNSRLQNGFGQQSKGEKNSDRNEAKV